VNPLFQREDQKTLDKEADCKHEVNKICVQGEEDRLSLAMKIEIVKLELEKEKLVTKRVEMAGGICPRRTMIEMALPYATFFVQYLFFNYMLPPSNEQTIEEI
jgi:predicted transport protein